MKKSIRVVITVLVLICLTQFAVLAAGNETIQAILSRDITITYNGKLQSFSDTKGNAVLPLIYNGSTYLPVRAVSEMVGIDVDYDANTKTVILGSKEVVPTKLVSLPNSGGTDLNWVINDLTELSIVGSDATMDFSSGVQFRIWNGCFSTGNHRMMYFDVDGYSKVTFTAWTDVASNVKVFDQDFEVISSFRLEAGSFSQRAMMIPDGVTKIAFGADTTKVEGSGNAKLLDPIVE